MNPEIEIKCPKCNRTIKKKLSELKAGNKTVCPGCRTSLNFIGDGAAKVIDELNSLERTIKNFGK